MLVVNSDAKISLHPIETEGAYWLEIWTHALEEMSIRHGPFPSGFTRDILHSESIPDLAGDLAERAANVLTTYNNSNTLIKFGKPKYMEDLHNSGLLRVQSASYYSKPDHNGAVRDDELALEYSIRLTEDQIRKLVINPDDVPRNAQPQRVDIRFENNSDYWLYCLTQTPQARLFVDFDATACVVIHDVAKFSQMIIGKFAAKNPNTTARHGKVTYIDPLLPRSSSINVPISKHFRYSYQKEYRFIWYPELPSHNLSCVDLELGNLKTISTLIQL